MKIIKKIDEFIVESVTNEKLLSLDELKQKYPQIKFTMNINPKFKGPNGENAYFVRADIETQGGKTEYLGALKGPVPEKDGLEFLNNVANKNYDKYY